MSAVCWSDDSFALTFAWRASNASTAAALPVREHVMSGVSPVACARFGSAPASARIDTIFALALVQASESGVTLLSFTAFTRAPARINKEADVTSSQ